LAGFTEAAGAAGGGMSMMPATAGVDGASGAVSGAAVAEATSAPVGPGLAGAAAKEVIDDGRSYSQRKKDGGGESKDPLPDAERAQIDENKFTRYSMDPNNPNNGGKAAAFRKIGYDIDELSAREAGAQNVIAQLRQQLSTSPATTGKSTSFGARFEVRVTIQGPAGSGSLVTVWQIDSGGTVPRLITNWLEVFK